MSDILFKNSGLNDYMLKLQHLVANVSITGHATPASKTHSVDISDSLFLKTQGKDDVTAQDPMTGLTITTENDVNGLFTVLIETRNCVQIKSAKVIDAAGNDVLAQSNVSALKNIVLEVNGADDLSAASTFSYRIELDFIAE